jgi:hypothetical protein
MSLLLDRVLNEIEQLSLAEQMQVLEHLVKQMKQSVESVAVAEKPKKKFKVSDFCGIVKYPMFGEDAQEWVSRTRREGDEHRERLLRGEL